MTTPTTSVVIEFGMAVIHDDRTSLEVPFEDIPAVVAGLLAAQDILADAR